MSYFKNIEAYISNFPSEYPLPAAQVLALTPPAAITGFATEAKQDSLLTELEKKADLTETQPVLSTFDTDDGVKKFKFYEDNLSVVAQDYLLALAEGDISGHQSFKLIGYTPTMNTSENDIWSAAGVYTFPTAAQQMEFLSSDNTADIGTSIFTGLSSGGDETSLIDVSKNFTAGTAVAVGDCVILDKSGSSPEFGYVTAVAATELTVGGGFSSGGNGDARDYIVVDASAYAGAQAVMIGYLTSAFVPKKEIIILNGTTVTTTVNTDIYRVNGMDVIATGANKKPTGAITLRNLSDTPVYGYITAGYNSMRKLIFTVPATKTLYITGVNFSYGYSTNQTHYARLYLRATYEANLDFTTNGIFLPQAEVVCANSSHYIDLKSPMKFPAGVDIKASGVATYSGIADCAIRGWLE